LIVCEEFHFHLLVPEVQGTIEEVARWKCREAADIVKGPVITEDTALCFDALGNLPGPYIKWFLEGIGLDGLNTMLVGFKTKTAKAICTMAYSAGPNTEPILFQGITTGRIVEARGPKNFGWDPIFQPDHPSEMTFAEMSAEVKNSISHRYKALNKLRQHFQQNL
jgi:inosine triphosphate pyrophosphatase